MVHKKTNSKEQTIVADTGLTEAELIKQGYTPERARVHPGLSKQIEVKDESTEPAMISIEVSDEDIPQVVADGLRLASASLRGAQKIDGAGRVMTPTDYQEVLNPNLTIDLARQHDAELAKK